jgi:hypothetical protein
MRVASDTLFHDLEVIEEKTKIKLIQEITETVSTTFLEEKCMDEHLNNCILMVSSIWYFAKKKIRISLTARAINVPLIH